jgi:hypothetical protein
MLSWMFVQIVAGSLVHTGIVILGSQKTFRLHWGIEAAAAQQNSQGTMYNQKRIQYCPLIRERFTACLKAEHA